MPTLLRLEKNVPEWFEETLAKTATEEHENVKKNDTNFQAQTERVPLSGLDIPIIWAGYSHYLGWIFLLPVPPTGCSLSPLQIGWLRGILNHFEPNCPGAPCPQTCGNVLGLGRGDPN